MQEFCIRFIMFYRFSQIKRNDSRQSSQTPFDSSLIKITTELKNNITKF